MKTWLLFVVCSCCLTFLPAENAPVPEAEEDSSAVEEEKVDLSKPREWRGVRGNTITGVFVSRDGGMIRLKDTENDRVYTMLLVQLAPEDRKLIEENTEP